VNRGRRVLARPTVLYIDDDRFLLTLCCDVLEGHGYRTLIATDGPSGIETAKEGRPDVILLDVLMPGMDGLEVCRHLRAVPDLRDTPIILLTARQELKLDAEGLDAGATLTLRKGFGSAELLSTIDRLLGRNSEPPTR
jgi:CheY-like chemotaxis protein